MRSNWKLIGDEARLTDEAKALYDEAMAAVPGGFLGEDVIEMLPRHKVIGSCRICGKTAELTKEHIPPKKSGNKARTIDYDIGMWLANQHIDVVNTKGQPQQGGVFGFTLCRECNSFTGAHYGTEYQRWAFSGYKSLVGLVRPEELNEQLGDSGEWSWSIRAQFGSVENQIKPGAFVRQVLSIMCSLSGTWDLAGEYPEIRRIILEQKLEPLPAELDLNMGLYLGPMLRFAGPQLRVDVTEGTWRWVIEMAFPPFSFLMVLASNKRNTLTGAIMNEWSMDEPTKAESFHLEMGVGFGWLPLPGDYRSMARIKKEMRNG